MSHKRKEIVIKLSKHLQKTKFEIAIQKEGKDKYIYLFNKKDNHTEQIELKLDAPEAKSSTPAASASDDAGSGLKFSDDSDSAPKGSAPKASAPASSEEPVLKFSDDSK